METLLYQLKSIRLSGMANNLQIRLQEALSNELTHQQFLQNLVDDELQKRRDGLLRRRLKQAHLPFLKTINDYDFNFNGNIKKAEVLNLATSAFISRKENVLFIGPPGVGKTHLAVAIALEAINKGFRVLYRSIFDVAREVIESHEEKIMENYIKPDLLIIDELGMKKLSPYSNDLLLEIFHRRYQKGSTLIASNRPIEDWGKILGDNATASAILDRLLENIHYLKIRGKSYRLKNLKGGNG